MRTDRKALAALTAIAQMRADQELRRYAAIRTHVETARQTVEATRLGLSSAIAAAPEPGIEGMRLMTALVSDLAGQLLQGEADLGRMKPAHDAARAKAMREFGRATAMRQLQAQFDRKPAS